MTENGSTYDYVILGAGITSLNMALALDNCNYAIYEKDTIVGGTCKTLEYDGFLFDYAEHFMRLDDDEVKQTISALLKENLESQRLNAAIYLQGRYVNYPFQTNLYGLPPRTVKECVLGYIEAYYSDKNPPENFEDWIYQSFGKGIAKYFMLPYNEKIWTVPPCDMTTDWFFNENVVVTGDLDQVIEGALGRKVNRDVIRWYPKEGGIMSLPKSYLSHIKNLNLNRKATEINLSEKKITFNGNTSVRYNKLINTIPLPDLIKIMTDAPVEIKRAANELKFNSVLCVNMGVDRSNISDKHWIYFPEKEFIFSRVCFPMNISKHMVPESKSSLSAIITYSENKPLTECDIKNRVIKDLIHANILNKTDKILVCETFDIKYGFNIYDSERKDNVEKIVEFLEDNDIHSIGRYGRWEYSGIEHSILESNALANKLLNTELL